MTVDPPDRPDGWPTNDDVRHVRFMVVGRSEVGGLAAAIEGLKGILQVRAVDANADID